MAQIFFDQCTGLAAGQVAGLYQSTSPGRPEPNIHLRTEAFVHLAKLSLPSVPLVASTRSLPICACRRRFYGGLHRKIGMENLARSVLSPPGRSIARHDDGLACWLNRNSGNGYRPSLDHLSGFIAVSAMAGVRTYSRSSPAVAAYFAQHR